MKGSVDLKFKVIYEDKNLIVAEKPQGIPCQADKTGDKDLYSMVYEYLSKTNKTPILNLINRIDRPVGGLVLFGKTAEATKKLSKDLLSRNIKKDYLAVVNGIPELEVAELKDFIITEGSLNISKVASAEIKNAKEAILSFKLLQSLEQNGENLSLLNIRLKTGRHHQIRLQLSNHGIPIWGDTKYNPEFQNVKEWHNIALWAYKLKLSHPITRKPLELYSLPEELYPWTLFELKK